MAEKTKNNTKKVQEVTKVLTPTQQKEDDQKALQVEKEQASKKRAALVKVSLRTKLIAIISILIIGVLGTNAGMLIMQNIDEGQSRLRESAKSFTSLSHKVVGDAYNLYGESGFINLKNITEKQLELHPDVTGLQIVHYNGQVLFDSQDKGPRTDMEEEKVPNEIMNAIQGRFDEEQSIIARPEVLEVVYPYYDDFENHSLSMRYFFSYDRIQAAVRRTIITILVVTATAILLAIIVGFAFASSIIRPLKKVMEGANTLATGDYSTQIELKTHDETRLLAETFNQMAKDLFANTQDLIEKERLEGEMSMAGDMQGAIIPKTLPVVNGLEMTASVESAEDVGGDVYDFIRMDDNKVVGYLGDATGHGVPAGLITTIANALIYYHALAGESVANNLIYTNKVLFAKTTMNMFITMAMFGWDGSRNTLSLAMAGHEQLMCYKPSTGKVELLPPGGMAIGMMEDLSMIIKEQEYVLEDGEILVMYSDGIPEAWAPNMKDIYGMEAFQASFEKHAQAGGGIQSIHDNLLKDVRKFMAGTPQQDDITLVLLRANKDIRVTAPAAPMGVQIVEPQTYT